MALADNHIHFLLGVDDGAKDEEVMHAMYMGKCGWKRQLRIPFSGFTTFARVWHHAG